LTEKEQTERDLERIRFLWMYYLTAPKVDADGKKEEKE